MLSSIPEPAGENFPHLLLAPQGRWLGGLVLAVRHEAYLKLTPDEVVKMTGGPMAVIDCFGILDDNAIRRYFELCCEVKGLGRGHVKRIKDSVSPGKPGRLEA